LYEEFQSYIFFKTSIKKWKKYLYIHFWLWCFATLGLRRI